MTQRVYAIPDIHGHLDALAGAHALIAADIARSGEPAPVVHLGDYVDRGPESAEVIEYLRAGPTTGGPWITLRGNHDYLFRLFLAAEPDLTPSEWLRDERFGPLPHCKAMAWTPRRTAPWQICGQRRWPACRLPIWPFSTACPACGGRRQPPSSMPGSVPDCR
ncbi:putative phosphoesterase [Rubellimicrobium thermophilum DSM 16684]|uniref:Putative phosphoesterase n=1 Tax=Rubellimicrobium thermophilum DSM 16684 TaxID=1123069 RepID=S9R2T4_9RHOB|nr:putative phosphoesterase [Rubellimicrobium thermophilum DSM 16684]